MAEKRQPLTKVKKQKPAERKSRAVTRRKPAAKGKEKAVAKPKCADAEHSTKRQFKAAVGKDGRKILFDSANATLVIKSKDIAGKLGEKAADGNIESAKLLMDMMKLGNLGGNGTSKPMKELISTLESDAEAMNSEAN